MPRKKKSQALPVVEEPANISPLQERRDQAVKANQRWEVTTGELIEAYENGMRNFELVDAKYLRLYGTEFMNASFRRANFLGCNMQAGHFDGSDFAGAIMTDADMVDGNFTDCNFQGADLQSTLLQRTRLSNSNFENAKMGGANLHLAKATNANFTGVDFEGADFGLVDLKSANLSFANLKGALMQIALLESTNLYETNLQIAVTSGNHWISSLTVFMPGGRRKDRTLIVQSAADGLRIWAGCQQGITLEEFKERVENRTATNTFRAQTYEQQAYPWLERLAQHSLVERND